MVFDETTAEGRLREDAVRQYVTSQLRMKKRTLAELSKGPLLDSLVNRPPTSEELLEIVSCLEKGGYIGKNDQGEYRILPL